MSKNPFDYRAAASRFPSLTSPVRPLRPTDLPPGAVPGAPSPRLPNLGGAQPYEPRVIPAPAPDPHTVLGAGSDVEHWQGTITTFPSVGSVQSVYKTLAPWTGIEVYLQPITLSTVGASFIPGSLRVLIYGVTSGVRALVAQSSTDAIRLCGYTATRSIPVFVCAAREVCDSYEVEIEAEPTANGPTSFDVQVTIVASDKATSRPLPNDTAWLREGTGALGTFTAQNQALAKKQLARAVGPSGQPMFLAGLQAVNTSSSAYRWVQVFDAGITAVPDTQPALLSFALAPNESLFVDEDGRGGKLLSSLEFYTGPRVIASSSPDLLTHVADVALTGWAR